MHPSAYETGRLFFQSYWQNGFKRILDIGSQDVNGTLRDFCPDGAEYVGVDIAEGKGVDVVLRDPYAFPFADGSFDLIVSSSCFEHDRMFWLTFLEACRLLSRGGFFYIGAPANGVYHSYPHDNWRFYPDAGLALEEWALRSGHDMHMTESFIATRIGPMEGESYWSDCVMVFTKGEPDAGRLGNICDRLPETKLVRPVNLRRLQSREVLNFSEDTQDMIEIRTLRAQVQTLRASYERLSQESAAALVDSHPPPACAGFVDGVRTEEGGGMLEGWAWDAARRKPARFVVLMVDDKPAASAAVCLPREDAAQRLGSEEANLGFVLPLSETFGVVGPPRCKVLAFADGYLGELPWAAPLQSDQRE